MTSDSLLASRRRLGAPPEQIVANAAVLLFGGIETTEGMIANAVAPPAPAPRTARAVRADRRLIDTAIEESLRLEPAAAVIDRYATADVELGGAPIGAGDLVGCRSRAPTATRRSSRRQISSISAAANGRRHLAFAHGPHVCVGVHLARLEARTALAALIEALPGLRPDPARRRDSGLVFRKPPALHALWIGDPAHVQLRDDARIRLAHLRRETTWHSASSATAESPPLCRRTGPPPAGSGDAVPRVVRAWDRRQTAYEQISNELLLDGQARLNLATFVTTWMPSIAAKLMAETADKNMIDKDEYPQTAEIESRCVNILAGTLELAGTRRHRVLDHRLERSGDARRGWRSSGAGASGCAPPASRPTNRPRHRPNVQVCWEKFCRYWDVEPKLVPMEGNRFHLGARGRRSPHVTRTRSASSRCSDRRSTAATSRSRRSQRLSTNWQSRQGGSTSRCMSTVRRVGSWHRSSSRRSSGTSGSRAEPKSINASGHKYGLVDRASAGRSGATRRGSAQGPDLRRELPRRSHADVLAELLAARVARLWRSI